MQRQAKEFRCFLIALMPRGVNRVRGGFDFIGYFLSAFHGQGGNEVIYGYLYQNAQR